MGIEPHGIVLEEWPGVMGAFQAHHRDAMSSDRLQIGNELGCAAGRAVVS